MKAENIESNDSIENCHIRDACNNVRIRFLLLKSVKEGHIFATVELCQRCGELDKRGYLCFTVKLRTLQCRCSEMTCFASSLLHNEVPVYNEMSSETNTTLLKECNHRGSNSLQCNWDTI